MLEKVCNKENKARVRVLLAGIKQIRAGVGAFRVSFCEGDVGGIGTSSATGIAPVLSTPSVSPPSQYQQQQPQQQPKNSIYALTATAKSVAILARSASTTTTAVAARAIDEINGILQRKPKTSSCASDAENKTRHDQKQSSSLERLRRMGFVDDELNADVLRECGGDTEAAAGALIRLGASAHVN